MDVQTLYVGNDMLLEVSGLRDDVTGDYLNAATVTVTLKDSAGVNVTGETWPLALAYVTSSNGVYRATLKDTLSLTANARYVATVIADGGEGKRAQWELDVVARTRRE